MPEKISKKQGSEGRHYLGFILHLLYLVFHDGLTTEKQYYDVMYYISINVQRSYYTTIIGIQPGCVWLNKHSLSKLRDLLLKWFQNIVTKHCHDLLIM